MNCNREPYLSVLIRYRNIPAVFFRYGFRYGKTETVMMSFTVTGFINPVEAIKKVLQFLRRNLIPVIGCAEHSRMPLALQRQFDLTSCPMPYSII